MLQVDWLTSTYSGLKLLETMAGSKDCQALFQTKAVQDMVNYLWRTSRPFFVYNYFISFFVLNYLPLLIMAFLMEGMENGGKDKHIV